MAELSTTGHVFSLHELRSGVESADHGDQQSYLSGGHCRFFI